ncbi:exosome subunit Rrp4 [Schizosaccharomyces japonicus yFS275]|uniref:Exosome subunit Rrp4 n=1 Tax=Schizosaccharomyces japonicus (strain yFS275 / FY16936) TaxID=402676 RepID=B6JY62_SCHJY|nr:exosome subunit Rrp4 [Schizosaccharomyces japonicus yFS275]EEB06480.1 exosome subunit Rrp4 [Schizosaccharomyces japonicus yFS275]
MITVLQPIQTYQPSEDVVEETEDTTFDLLKEEEEDEDEMDLDVGDEVRHLRNVVTPGQLITEDPQFMRGHGTYADGARICASVAGIVQRVNKLISVKPFKSRYVPEIGDLVVGRITEVQPKRWKVDIGVKLDAILMLSSINLPGGVQRRKSETDELQMRTFFQENDLLVAEVQQYFSDGSVSIHTRSLKYGKLRNGVFLKVPPVLIVRSKVHSYSFPGGVDVILSVNGYVWISKHMETQKSSVSITRLEEEASFAIYSNENDEIEPHTRLAISRMYICIQALAARELPLTEATILSIYELSLQYTDLQQLTNPEVLDRLAVEVMHQ